MAGLVRFIVEPVSKHSALIVAISSLFVAGLSLYFTIEAQRGERSYKELLLKPNLQLEAETSDYSIKLVNSGLGPAEIKDAFYYLGGECITLIGADRQLNQKNYFTIIQRINAGFVDQMRALPWRSEFKGQPVTHGAIPVQSAVIRVGAALVIFQIDPAFLHEFSSELTKLGVPIRREFDNNFITNAIQLPYRVKYCSMSGKYCEVSGGGDEQAIPCKFAN